MYIVVNVCSSPVLNMMKDRIRNLANNLPNDFTSQPSTIEETWSESGSLGR